MDHDENRGPVVAPPGAEGSARSRSSWGRAAGVAASVVAIAAVGGFFWRRSRKRRVEEELTPLSHEWLAEHYYKAGQQGDDD